MPCKEDSPAPLSPKEVKLESNDPSKFDQVEEDESEHSEECTDMNGDGDSSEPYSMDLPLEVITTVGSQPYNCPYPVLKNMSNGVLTHRNIFTEFEREILTNIVEKYRVIVDARSRTREIYLEKQNVWQQIVDEYNNTENVLSRTEKELRKCWDNMKYRARLAQKSQQPSENQQSTSHSDAVQAAIEKILSAPSPDSCPSDNNFSIKEENHDENGQNSDDRSSHELSEDDEAPAFKKARQESPKLSSLLLRDSKKSATRNSIANSPSVSQYTIPNCTKVTHVKRKLVKRNGTNHVSILPKNVSSSVSVHNIANPNQVCFSNSMADEFHNGSINLGGGVTISPQRTPNYSVDIKPMPTLKRIPQTSMRNGGLKKTSRHSNKSMSSNGDAYNSHDELDIKILTQRVRHEDEQHAMKLKVLEKQLQASSNESQFWALKIKLLKSAHQSPPHNGTNGDA